MKFYRKQIKGSITSINVFAFSLIISLSVIVIDSGFGHLKKMQIQTAAETASKSALEFLPNELKARNIALNLVMTKLEDMNEQDAVVNVETSPIDIKIEIELSLRPLTGGISEAGILSIRHVSGI